MVEVYFFIPLILFCTIVIILMFVGYHTTHKRKHPSSIAIQRYNQAIQVQATHDRALDQRKRAAERLAACRLDEEELKGRGAPVWFLRTMTGPSATLVCWAIIIDGVKYQFTRDGLSGSHGDKYFAHAVVNEPFWSVQKERDDILTSDPDSGSHICLIGWTTLPPYTLGTISTSLADQFTTSATAAASFLQPSGPLTWANVQIYFLDFACRIIAPEDRALDWSWFFQHISHGCKRPLLFPPTPEEEMSMINSEIKVVQRGVGAGMGAGLVAGAVFGASTSHRHHHMTNSDASTIVASQSSGGGMDCGMGGGMSGGAGGSTGNGTEGSMC